MTGMQAICWRAAPSTVLTCRYSGCADRWSLPQTHSAQPHQPPSIQPLLPLTHTATPHLLLLLLLLLRPLLQAAACLKLLLQLCEAAPPDAVVGRTSDVKGGGQVLLVGHRGVMGNTSTRMRECAQPAAAAAVATATALAWCFLHSM